MLISLNIKKEIDRSINNSNIINDEFVDKNTALNDKEDIVNQIFKTEENHKTIGDEIGIVFSLRKNRNDEICKVSARY